ncbi:hypothetical protein [Micromonospora sp. HM5-17]|nr:hypothetical protein [Micromonospora sp. HM5-17]
MMLERRDGERLSGAWPFGGEPIHAVAERAHEHRDGGLVRVEPEQQAGVA